MHPRTRLFFSLAVATIVAGGAFGWGFWQKHMERERFRPFADCLIEKGVKFYGLFWNADTIRQRELFGEGADLMPYTECASEDGQRMLDICRNEKIASFPLWKFRSDDRQTGVLSLEALADRTGCQVP